MKVLSDSFAAFMMKVLTGARARGPCRLGNTTNPLNSGDSFMHVYSPKAHIVADFLRIHAVGLSIQSSISKHKMDATE